MHEFKRVPVNNRAKSKRGLVLGVGINDADYLTEIRVDGKRVVCPAYRAWKHILRRCYCEIFLMENKTYREVSVCDEWHIFSNFREWFDKNHVDGWQIDKDILTPSKVYGPSTCIYVPRWLNNFTEDHRGARGPYKIGVSWHAKAGAFLAACSNPLSNRRSGYIGLYDAEEEAHLAWLAKKKEIALILKPKMDEIDERIYPRVVQIIEELK